MSYAIFQFRRDTAAAWTAVNPTLESGELGLETDSALFKIGDGATPWNALSYGGIQGPPGASFVATFAAPGVIEPDDTAQEGISTALARADHQHAIQAAPPVALGAMAAEGVSLAFSRADHVHVNPVIAHESAVDPHPIYTTAAEAAAAAPVQSVNGQQGAVSLQIPSFVSAVLTATQANSTVTPAVLTGHTFTIPPGRTLKLAGQVIFVAAATTTGAGIGIRCAQGAGANANAVGSWATQVELSSAPTALGIADGDVFNVAGGANALGETLGTASVAGNNAAHFQTVIRNLSTNANTTVTVEFRSEVAGSAVTAQIGTSSAGIIG